MTVARLRLHHRIVIPFALVALVATSAAAYVALSVATRTMDSRVQAQMLNAVGVVGRSDLALNPAILRSIQDITGGDVLTYRSSGEVLASTFDVRQRAGLVSAVQAADPLRQPGTGGGASTPLVRIDCGSPCYVAYSRVQGRPSTVVALVQETSQLTAATSAVTRAILIAAALGLIVMVIVSQAVARRVTAPIDQLVEFVRGLASPGARRRAAVGPDEVGRLATAFNEMLDRVERSQEALVKSEKLGLAGLMAAQVAHDIRNPLSSIKMQTQLLQSRLGAHSEYQATLGAILHDIDSVESVIRDLLELARPGEVRLEPTRVNEVVNDVLAQLSAQFTHRKIAVTTHFDESLPLVPLDASRLKRALVNLLVNASEAMPTGGAVDVVTRRTEAGTAVEIEILDTGAGIDPAILSRAFDPFVSTKREGMGLGLANVKAIVESHRGHISLDRREPNGTRAVMRLPVDPAAAHGGQPHPEESDG